MARILISACLVGRPVRYDGSAKTLRHPIIERWHQEGWLVPLCPEVAAGLAIPRLPAEIAAGASGEDVLAGKARVIERDGSDVTGPFIAAARLALETARLHDCRFALLIDGSPSCGSRAIYDGAFNGVKHEGAGVTAALLKANGIEVFSHREVEILAERVQDASRVR